MLKALIVLQENSGRVTLPDDIPDWLRDGIFQIIDSLAETFEVVKTQLQASDDYDKLYFLTDAQCTRDDLLHALISETKANRVVDLVILGHGSAESLKLHDEHLTGGSKGSIRSLLSDAQNQDPTINKFNLRMVYMCNCFGSTVNDDWLSIGAMASVGSWHKNYMPEPMLTFFMRSWLDGKTVKESAESAYTKTIKYYLPLYPPDIDFSNGRSHVELAQEMKDSKPVVLGNQFLLCTTELLDVEYMITLKTGNIDFAGTDANVFITLYGDKGSTDEIVLDNPGNDRERNATDIYRIMSRDIGNLTKVRLRHDNAHAAAGWYVSSMVIKKATNKGSWKFNSLGWLADDEFPNKIDRVFNYPPDQSTYTISIRTSDVRLAGTDANVYIVLEGTDGTTPRIKLDTGNNDHERGSLTVHTVNSIDVGNLRSIRLLHDDTGVGPGWRVDSVTIRKQNSPNLWTFHGIGWLAKDEAPFSIDRRFSVD